DPGGAVADERRLVLRHRRVPELLMDTFNRIVRFVQLATGLAAASFVILLFVNEPQKPPPVPVQGASVGKAIFATRCATCHGADAGSNYSNNFNGGTSDSQQAFDLLRTRFPARAGDTADVVFSADDGVYAPGPLHAIDTFLAKFAPGKVPHVVSVASPYTSPG